MCRGVGRAVRHFQAPRRRLTFDMSEPASLSDIPIIFLSGMAADARLFKAQIAAFPNLRVQAWAPARQGESLCAYAERLAREVDPGRPCLVGGASFGGVVALELATRLPALGCILIASVRSPAGIPWRWRALRPIAALGPDNLGRLAAASRYASRPLLTPRSARRLEKLSSPEADFVRWATCALLNWRPSLAAQRVRIFQIHGEADHVFPAARTQAEVLVAGGVHALPLFSSTAVNEFIANAVRSVTTGHVT